jgi:hypothetical protein
MKAKGGQQRYQSSNHIQLPPLVLAPATTQPRFECYSSSSLNSCSSSDHCPSAYTPPSSSMRYSYNTPSPSPMDAPMPEASGHCFGNYDSRRYSQSPGGSSFPSTYRSYPSSYRDQNPFPPPPLRQHESPTLRLSSMAPYPSSAPPLNTSPSFAASQEYATARYDMAISQGAFGYNASCYIKQESPSPSQREDSLGPGDVTFTSEDVIEADRTVLPLPPSPIRKVRSSLHSPNQVRASSPRKTKIKLTRKNKAYLRQQKLNEWHQYLDEFLRSDQASLLSSRAGTILTTLAANGQAMVTTSTVKNFKSTTSTSSRNRNNIHGAISTHRFVLPINVEAKDWHSLAQSTTGTIATTDEEIANHGCYYISCVRWERELWITKWVMINFNVEQKLRLSFYSAAPTSATLSNSEWRSSASKSSIERSSLKGCTPSECLVVQRALAGV